MIKKSLIVPIVAAIIVLGFISLFIGVKDIIPLDLFQQNSEEVRVFILSRIPRLMSLICVGMGMAIAGAIMQCITANRFVSPSTASTTEWARLGVLVAIMIFPSAHVVLKAAIATIFAFAGSMLFIRLLNAMKLKDQAMVPLIGMMLGSVVASITIFVAYKYDVVQNISSWLQGNFTMVLQGRYELLYLSIPLLIVALLYADRFTITSMGSDFPKSLGINYNRVVNIGILIAALITSVVASTVGIIPFVGMIIPNIVRMYRGDNFKSSIWEIALIGALFIIVCDIFARLIIYPFEIPISVLIGIIGSIFFLYLVLGKGKRKKLRKPRYEEKAQDNA